MIYVTLGILGFIFWFGFRLADSMSRFTPKTIWVELWEEFLWAIPIYGRKKKGEYIRNLVGGPDDTHDGCMLGHSKSYKYSEIRRLNSYEEAGGQMLPGIGWFVGVNIFLPAFPIILYYVVNFIGSLF